MIGFDLVPPLLHGAAAAALAGLAVAGAARLLKRPRLAGAAAGIGLVAGLAVVLGLFLATPRQLAERLPLLAVIGLVAGAMASLPQRALAAAGVVLGLAGGAWWMAGAPLYGPNLVRILPVGAALLVGMALAWWRGGQAMPVACAWLGLAAALMAAASRGPQGVLALAGAGAVIGAALPGAAFGPASRLTHAVVLGGVAALPLLARAAPADIACAAAPALALLAGPVVGARLPGAVAWLGPAIAALPAVAVAYAAR